MTTTTMNFQVQGCTTLAEGRARASAIASAFFEQEPQDIKMNILVEETVSSYEGPVLFDMRVEAWVAR